MPTFIDWPAQFNVQQPRVTATPAAESMARKERQDATKLPESRTRITTNPFATAPRMGQPKPPAPDKGDQKRQDANDRGNPITDALGAVGKQASAFGGAAVHAGAIVGGEVADTLLLKDKWDPKDASDFRGAPVQGPGLDGRDIPGGTPATGSTPAARSGVQGPGLDGRDQRPTTGSAAQMRMLEESQRDGGIESPAQRQARLNHSLALVRRAETEKRNQALTRHRLTWYQKFQGSNIPRSEEGKAKGSQVVPYVNVQNAAEWKRMGLNIPQGFQGPEYQGVMFGEVWDKRSDAGAVVQRSTPEQLARLRAASVRLGLVKENDLNYLPIPGGTVGDMTAVSRLQAFVNETQFTSINQVIDWSERQESALIAARGGYGANGGSGAQGPTNTTQKTFNKTSLDQGRGILRQTMREMMGREPTDSEVKQYVSALNKREAKTPQVVSTTYGAGGSVITSKTLANAPDPAEVLRQQAEKDNDPEVVEYEATQYMGTLDDMLGGL